jgi:hypothetical protein
MNNKKIRLQEAAIQALLEEPTIQAAADRIEVNQATLFQWMKDTDFQSAYRDARKDVLIHAVAKAQTRLSKGADFLWSILEDTKATATARVNAFNALKDLALKGYEIDNLEARMEALEATLGASDDEG